MCAWTKDFKDSLEDLEQELKLLIKDTVREMGKLYPNVHVRFNIYKNISVPDNC